MRKEPLLFGFLLVYGYLFMLLKPVADPGLGFALFGFCGLGLLCVYLLAAKNKISPTGIAILVPSALLCLSFALFENSTIIEPLCLCAVLFAAAFAYYAGSKPFGLGGITGIMGLFTFGALDSISEKAQKLFSPKKDRKTITQILIGLVISLPVLIILVSLLAGADMAFESAVNTLAHFISDKLMEQLIYIVCAILIAGYLYSVFLSAGPEKATPSKASLNMPATIANVVLLCVNLLYLFFFAIQIKHIIQADTAAYNLSMLAREGFFELCFVCAINFGLFTLAHKLIKTKSRFLTGLMLVLCLMTQAIIITCVLKMRLYISLYGLTLLRVQTLWFMVSLFLAFIAMALRLFKAFPLVRWVAALCAASIVLISFANIGGLVATTNADRYLKGSLKEFHMSQYSLFPYESVPALISVYENTQDEALKQDLLAFLQKLPLSSSPNSLQQFLAQNALKSFFSAQ